MKKKRQRRRGITVRKQPDRPAEYQSLYKSYRVNALKEIRRERYRRWHGLWFGVPKVRGYVTYVMPRVEMGAHIHVHVHVHVGGGRWKTELGGQMDGKSTLNQGQQAVRLIGLMDRRTGDTVE
jgi:hypothetical protein